MTALGILFIVMTIFALIIGGMVFLQERKKKHL